MLTFASGMICSRNFASELLPWSWVFFFFLITLVTTYLGRLYGTYDLTSLVIFEECYSIVVRISYSIQL